MGKKYFTVKVVVKCHQFDRAMQCFQYEVPNKLEFGLFQVSLQTLRY